jgi:hypothetical protein
LLLILSLSKDALGQCRAIFDAAPHALGMRWKSLWHKEIFLILSLSKGATPPVQAAIGCGIWAL